VRTIIKSKHHELHKALKKDCFVNFLDYIFDKERWWLIIILVAIFIFIGMLNIPLPNFLYFSFTYDSAKIIVDQRTANIATITSVTLAVVGFLISNLAVKEAYAYGLLFKRTYLYPIIYFILTTIGYLMIVSLFRDTFLRDDLTKSHFNRAVVLGTYLALTTLVLIGFLFRRIIAFTNGKEIRKMLHDELLFEARANLYTSLYKNYSQNEYNIFLVNHGAKKYDWLEALGNAQPKFTVVDPEQIEEYVNPRNEKLLYNIDLEELAVFIRANSSSERVYYTDLYLGCLVNDGDNFIWANDRENSISEKKKLRRAIVVETHPVKQKDNLAMRRYFDQKLEEWSEAGEAKNINDLLKSYLELYELQMKNNP